jgi:hypothetical protein
VIEASDLLSRSFRDAKILPSIQAGEDTGGWSQRALRKLLRMSRTRLRQLVATGMLRVRGPRITPASLTVRLTKNRTAHDPAAMPLPTPLAGYVGNPCSWKRAAKVLKIEVADVQRLISVGQLKLVDTFVTDRAFEEFCRKHGTTINLSLIDTSTRKWLITEYVYQIASRTEKYRARKSTLSSSERASAGGRYLGMSITGI